MHALSSLVRGVMRLPGAALLHAPFLVVPPRQCHYRTARTILIFVALITSISA